MKPLLRIIKTGDLVLAGLLLTGSLFGFIRARQIVPEGRIASIYVNNRELYRLSLFESRTLIVDGCIGETCIQIDKGQIWVEKAPCPYQICKRSGKISRPGEIIVCIPNRLLIRIRGIHNKRVDSVTM